MVLCKNEMTPLMSGAHLEPLGLTRTRTPSRSLTLSIPPSICVSVSTKGHPPATHLR